MEVAKLTVQCINGRQIFKKPSTERVLNELNKRMVYPNIPYVHSHLFDGLDKDIVFIDKKAITNPKNNAPLSIIVSGPNPPSQQKIKEVLGDRVDLNSAKIIKI